MQESNSHSFRGGFQVGVKVALPEERARVLVRCEVAIPFADALWPFLLPAFHLVKGAGKRRWCNVLKLLCQSVHILNKRISVTDIII